MFKAWNEVTDDEIEKQLMTGKSLDAVAKVFKVSRYQLSLRIKKMNPNVNKNYHSICSSKNRFATNGRP